MYEISTCSTVHLLQTLNHVFQRSNTIFKIHSFFLVTIYLKKKIWNQLHFNLLQFWAMFITHLCGFTQVCNNTKIVNLTHEIEIENMN